MLEIISRKSALEEGRSFYFTGKPCVAGHLEKRRCSNWVCHACELANRNTSPSRTSEQNSVRSKKYYKEHRERILKNVARYQSENRKAISIRKKEYRSKNKNRITADRQRRRAREKSAKGFFTETDVKLILSRQRNKCAEKSCGANISKIYHIDHVMPLCLGGSNWPNNLQGLCPECNRAKNGLHPVDWARKKGRLL